MITNEYFLLTPEISGNSKYKSTADTKELWMMVNTMAGRDLWMAELKDMIKQLRKQLEEAGMAPLVDDPQEEIRDHV